MSDKKQDLADDITAEDIETETTQFDSTQLAPEEEKPEESSKPKRKRRRKLLIALGAAVVVVAALGVGFAVWHEQPSFCNAVCHQPMDNYVEGYYSQQAGLLAADHSQADVSCLDCHEATLSDQIREGTVWLQGDFSVDEAGFIVSESSAQMGTREFCFKCHDDGDASTGKDWEQIVEATTEWGGDEGVNPHKSHQGEEDCMTCHSSHQTSIIACDSCHGWETPEGWEKPKLY
jgi:hypothetical protein